MQQIVQVARLRTAMASGANAVACQLQLASNGIAWGA